MRDQVSLPSAAVAINGLAIMPTDFEALPSVRVEMMDQVGTLLRNPQLPFEAVKEVGVEAVKELRIVGRNHGEFGSVEGGLLEVELSFKRGHDAFVLGQAAMSFGVRIFGEWPSDPGPERIIR